MRTRTTRCSGIRGVVGSGVRVPLFFHFDRDGRVNGQGDDQPTSVRVLLDLTVPPAVDAAAP
jgi:hypothetical protein